MDLSCSSSATEKTVFSPLKDPGDFVENQLTTYLQILFWVLFFSWIHLSLPYQHCIAWIIVFYSKAYNEVVWALQLSSFLKFH